MGKALKLGSVEVSGRVWTAPMTGISDLPFRQIASRLGAPYVATEMVACAELARGRPDVVRRAAVGEGLPLTVIQLVGRDPAMIAEGARMARAAGADIIDLNFGCPAKEVTGGLCGSALMRDLDVAERLVAAATGAVDVPVTVKMRLGWDDSSRNAPEFAQRAEQVGAAGFTVHGRTRCQFYRAAADWAAVREVKSAVTVPVLVNGDVCDAAGRDAALSASGADGVMIGRAATGRPWLPALLEGRRAAEPGRAERTGIVLDHLALSLSFYGERLGLRVFRKHLAAYIEAAPWPSSAQARRAARADLCRLDSARELEARLSDLWNSEPRRLAA
ncbi:MAG: tRNA dihydrouridine synthase [Caulobacterales bacterium]